MLDNLSLGRHISGQFNAELESIRTHVLAMGGLVEQQLADSLKAMHQQDAELAKRVIKDDHKVKDRKSTRLNSSHSQQARMPSSA